MSGLHYPLRRIRSINEGGGKLVSALIGVYLAHNIVGVGAFGFRRFGNSVIDFRLVAIKTVNRYGVIRLQ